MVFDVGTRGKRSCRAGISLVKRWPRLQLRLGCPLERWIVDRALHGFKPSGGPTVIRVVAHDQLDEVPDERSKLGTFEYVFVENGVDSDRRHEGTVPRSSARRHGWGWRLLIDRTPRVRRTGGPRQHHHGQRRPDRARRAARRI